MPLSLSRRTVVRALAGGAGIAAFAPIASSIAVVAIDMRQHAANARFAADHYASAEIGSRELVVYFSRSGNTEIMALELAKTRRASVARIEDVAYPIGFRGWLNALRDAGNTESSIAPTTPDLRSYETIYIGAPIWLYSPAPPIWEFIRRSDITGKRVVLFNSLNSNFEQEYIDQFASIVRERGGTFSAHLYVVRGRMTRQLDTLEFLAAVRKRLMQLPSHRPA